MPKKQLFSILKIETCRANKYSYSVLGGDGDITLCLTNKFKGKFTRAEYCTEIMKVDLSVVKLLINNLLSSPLLLK
jgi:hypothetical protein